MIRIETQVYHVAAGFCWCLTIHGDPFFQTIRYPEPFDTESAASRHMRRVMRAIGKAAVRKDRKR